MFLKPPGSLRHYSALDLTDTARMRRRTIIEVPLYAAGQITLNRCPSHRRRVPLTRDHHLRTVPHDHRGRRDSGCRCPLAQSSAPTASSCSRNRTGASVIAPQGVKRSARPDTRVAEHSHEVFTLPEARSGGRSRSASRWGTTRGGTAVPCEPQPLEQTASHTFAASTGHTGYP